MKLKGFLRRWRPANAQHQLLLAIAGAVFLATLLASACARAQQAVAPPPTDREVIAELLRRVQLLEARVKELEAERAQDAGPAKPIKAAPIAETPVRAAPQEEHEMAMTGPEPKLRIRGFTDITLHGSNQKGSTTSFTLGQMNLFITSDVSEKFKFLSEIVFEA